MMIPIYHSTVPVTSTFRHAPLDDGRQFRLLKLYPAHFALRKDAPWLIEYEIVHCSLDNAPPYEAISYVWGSHDKTHMIRLLPGNRTLAVTASVDKVLADMKKHSTTGYLWIDQFCISQEDELERSHQVTLMGEIYSKARRTLVWTGEPNGYLEDLVGTLKVLGAPSESNAFRRSRNDAHAEVQRDALRIRAHLESMFPSACSRHSTVRGPGSDVMDMDGEDQSEDEGHCRKCVDAFADNFADSTSRFLARQPVYRQFSRCWIVQEVLLARQVYLAAGDVLISPNDFHRVLSATFLVPKLEKAASKAGDFPDEEPSLHSLNFMAFFWDSFEHGEIPLFSSLLVNLRDGAVSGHFKTSNPRDFIYAFLGLHPHGKALINPDYSWPVEIVYADVARAVIEETGDLSILGVCDSLYHKDRMPSLPSWVPDWSRSCWVRALFGPTRQNNFAACGPFQHATQPRRGAPHLLVMGTPIDRITTIQSPRLPRERPGSTPRSTQDGERRDSQAPDYLELGKTAEELSTTRHPRLSAITPGRILSLLHAGEASFPDDYQYTWRERESILRYAAGRQVAQGVDEPLALVPAPSIVGDEIWLLRGCPAPVVLRRDTRTVEGYQLVGACFVEGTMRGEEAHRLEAARAIHLT